MQMLKKIVLFCFFLLLMQCKKDSQLKVNFINEFVLADSLFFDGYKVGGISDITFVNDTLFMVVDDAEYPRILKAKINLKNQQLADVNIVAQTLIKIDSTIINKPYFDIEALFVTKKGDLFVASEGNINLQKPPQVFNLDTIGNVKNTVQLPTYLADITNHYHNKSFEAMCLSYDQKGFWLATESPLKNDGEPAGFEEKNYPVRISYFDFEAQKFTKQFVFLLDNVKNKSNAKVVINGLTSIIQLTEFQFIIIEREYQSGLGSYGNKVRLYQLTIDNETTNTIELLSLTNTNYKPLKKQLLFDFETIKSQLSEGIVDNLEGITLGPKLVNGNQSLILASDDNFQVYGKQLNQFVLFELQK